MAARLSKIQQEPYYRKRGFRLYNVDAHSFLKEMPDNSVDMVFADPPYFLSGGTFTCHNGKKVSVKKGDWDIGRNTGQNFDFHFSWLSECRRILKDNGTIWVSGTYHSIYMCGYAMQMAGYHILNDVAWFKPNASPNLSCRYFTASHETLIWARKHKKSKHIFNYQLMKKGNWEGDFIKKPDSQMRSVWAIGTPQANEKSHGKHPTQKPEKLLQRIILASTNEGDLILDPFTGSSTTGIVACRLKRKFVGIDSDKKFLDLSIKRFECTTRNRMASLI